jgi:hypothetical protein
VSYEVDTKHEVKEKLADLGVDSVQDVRRAGGAFHHDVPTVIQAEQLSLQAHGTPGSMTVVLEDLLAVNGHIGKLRDEIHGILGDAKQLGGHQFDGWGPIADRMAACVSDRAGPDAGVERALISYLTELEDLASVLTQAAALYAEVDQHGEDQLRKAAHGNE